MPRSFCWRPSCGPRGGGRTQNPHRRGSRIRGIRELHANRAVRCHRAPWEGSCRRPHESQCPHQGSRSTRGVLRQVQPAKKNGACGLLVRISQSLSSVRLAVLSKTTGHADCVISWLPATIHIVHWRSSHGALHHLTWTTALVQSTAMMESYHSAGRVRVNRNVSPSCAMASTVNPASRAIWAMASPDISRPSHRVP